MLRCFRMPRIKLHIPKLWFLPVLLLVMLVLVLVLVLVLLLLLLLLLLLVLLLVLLMLMLMLVQRLPFHAAPPNFGPQRPQTLPLALERLHPPGVLARGPC